MKRGLGITFACLLIFLLAFSIFPNVSASVFAFDAKAYSSLWSGQNIFFESLSQDVDDQDDGSKRASDYLMDLNGKILLENKFSGEWKNGIVKSCDEHVGLHLLDDSFVNNVYRELSDVVSKMENVPNQRKWRIDLLDRRSELDRMGLIN